MKYVVLDRDGVINFDSEFYIKTPDEWQPIPNSLEAIALLNRKGYKVAVATNQSGLARKLYDEITLAAIHQKMYEQLKTLNATIETIAYCPHGPNDGCLCRKPEPGLLHHLRDKYGVSLNQTPFVGDSLRDLEAGLKAGCTPILVKTGNGQKTWQSMTEKQKSEILVFDDLFAFAQSLS